MLSEGQLIAIVVKQSELAHAKLHSLDWIHYANSASSHLSKFHNGFGRINMDEFYTGSHAG